MKGVLVAKPVVFTLEVKGEDFRQGDSLPCRLVVSNQSGGSLGLLSISLDLSLADLRKLKSHAENALSPVLTSGGFQIQNLAPQQSAVFEHVFKLDPNATISEKSESLCFSFGSTQLAGGISHLPVTVLPHWQIEKMAELFQSPFQFVFKSVRSKDGWVEYKFKPPSARNLAQLDELTVGLSFDQGKLKLRYNFKIKSFDTSTVKGTIKKSKSVFEQVLDPAEYMLSAVHLNHTALEHKIAEALESVSSGLS